MRLAERLAARFGTATDIAACQLVVERCFPTLSGHGCRVDLLRLVAECGIRLERTADRNFEGCIKWSTEGAPTLILSELGSAARQRFTIAHELGHFALRCEMLDEGGEAAYRSINPTRRELADEENLANLIAAEILMPRSRVISRLKEHGFSLGSIKRLSFDFGVSRMAMLRRVGDLTDRCAIFLSVVPRRFRDQSTAAEIDEAVFMLPGHPPKKRRDRISLLGAPAFDAIRKSVASYAATVQGEFGTCKALFNGEYCESPIPHLNLLAFDVSTEFEPVSAVGST